MKQIHSFLASLLTVLAFMGCGTPVPVLKEQNGRLTKIGSTDEIAVGAIHLLELGADPTAEADTALIYAKDVGGVTQLFTRTTGAISQTSNSGWVETSGTTATTDVATITNSTSSVPFTISSLPSSQTDMLRWFNASTAARLFRLQSNGGFAILEAGETPTGTDQAGTSVRIAASATTGSGTAKIDFRVPNAGQVSGSGTNSVALALSLETVDTGLTTSMTVGKTRWAFGPGAHSVTGNNGFCIGDQCVSGGGVGLSNGAESPASGDGIFGGSIKAITQMYVGNGKTVASPSAATIQGTGGLGTDIAGAGLTIAGGRGTGAGAGGTITFSTSAAGASASTLRSLTSRMTIDSTGLVTNNGVEVVTGEIGANGGLGRSTSGALSVGTDAESTSVSIGAQTTVTTINGSTGFATGANGQVVTMKQLTESKAVTGAVNADTTIAIPQDALVYWVSARVTTAVTGPATWGYCRVADGVVCTRYGSVLANTVNGTFKGSDTAGAPQFNTGASTAIRIRATDGITAFTGGVIRITIHYMEVTPPTN